MGSGRRPLFDLMTDPARYPRAGGAPAAPQPPATPTPAPVQAARPAPPARPPVASSTLEAKPAVLKPQPAPVPPPLPSKAPEAERPAAGGRSAVTVPLSWVYWIVTASVVLFVGIWWGGFLAGNKDAARRYGRELSPPNGAVNPEATSQPNNPPPPAPQPIQNEPAAKDPPVSTATGDIFAASGWTDLDPRQKGMNYLRVATLTKADAVRVVEYLKGKGKASVAVPSRAVERGPDGGKNPGSYFVYLLTPLTRDQYRDGKTAVRIENEVKAIGKEWAKQKDRGPTDFASVGWVKFD